MDQAMRKTAFKVGFLRGLAELGITPSELYAHTKQAFDILDAGKSILSGGADLAGGAAKTLGAAALLAPLAIGGATGAASGLMNSPPVESVDTLRKAELLGLYQRLTKEIQARHRARRGQE